ncbi:uncharacterized protein SAPINGB_P000611 [Magnusiomyces paraingens]|uniref:Peptidase M20 dimerisation domain-containing protein n=1 Tax=Magnusiomyces paraingens TaxID=2606893 RepID=A0A5E8B8D2_9ASCO|nr:uncharacterized protein SAPINGB_P000611 [Saprochaete ingens]VVT45021.1 unnamed protein product [Saprochaete ingens]
MSFDADSYFNGPRKELYRLHKELVEIESISGDEKSVGSYLKTYLENLGYTVEWQPVPEKSGRERANLYAYKGEERNTRVLLTSHIDTVPPYFGYSVVDDRIYGRGTVDDKNCVAAMIIALEELLTEKNLKSSDVGLLFVVEEEIGGPGMQFANKHLGINSWETVIFGEPTEMKLGVGHKGIVMFNYVARGKAAHSGYPELGVNATDTLVDALYKLRHSSLPKSDLLGESTVNVGIIKGGVAGNVIPERAEAFIMIRASKDTNKIIDIVKSIAAEYENLEIEELHSVPEQLLEYDVPGFESIVLAYATDVPYLEGNFTRFLYGSGSIHVAHSDHEYVPIKELYDSVDGYKKLIEFSLAK